MENNEATMTGTGEVWEPTMNLRVLIRSFGRQKSQQIVGQQEFKSNTGKRQWRDIPTVHEDKNR